MFGPESYARWAGPRLGVQLEPKDFRGVEPSVAVAYAKDQAERAAETQILDAIDENLPAEEDQSEWNWEAMTKWVNNRFNTNYTVAAIKKIDRDRMDEEFISKSNAFIDAIDLSEGEPFLDMDYGNKMLVSWMQSKFGIPVDLNEIKGLEPEAIKRMMLGASEKAYLEREAQYPVLVGFHRFREQTGPNSYVINGAAMATWAAGRFQNENVLEKLQADSEHPFEVLVEVSRANAQKSTEVWKSLQDKLDSIYGKNTTKKMSEFATGSNSAQALASWMQTEFDHSVEATEVAKWTRDECRSHLIQAYDDKYHPEIRRMERTVLLSTLDSAWKDHLLAMDHVRSSVSFRSMGQMDPKVEYKREGMRLFDQMWLSLGERITDVIFRMEAIDEDLVANSWVETSARHDSYDATKVLMEEKMADLQAAEQARGETSSSEPDPVTIRNRSEKASRNDPCPCGSGKKFKNCCMRKQV
jgi:preprotein translocase subunit SecA